MNNPHTEHANSNSEAKYRYFPAPTSSLSVEMLEVDLYLIHGENGEPALYRSSGLPFTSDDAARLRDSGVKFVYIPLAQHAAYRKMLLRMAEGAFSDPSLASKERGKIVRATCSKIIEDVLMFPGWPEAVSAVEDISACFEKWSEEFSSEFSYVLDMTAHDFYTSTHMVNVGVGCGMLAKAMRPGEPDLLRQVFQGGLLHDLGKRGVPEDILNKESKPTDDEWELIKAHPMNGYDELRARQGVSDIVLMMTRDHHEKLDGSGYPAGLRGDQITFHARMCCIVDTYDALTTSRPYRGPIPPVKALAIMRKEAGTKLDPEIFEAWESLVHRLLRDDPSRSFGSRLGSVTCVSAAPRDPNLALSHLKSEKRWYPRYQCQLLGQACFEHRGKPDGPDIGMWFPVGVVDISIGGLGLRFDFAPSKGDLILVRVPHDKDQVLERQGEIVRIRQGPNGTWLVGVRFTNLVVVAA